MAGRDVVTGAQPVEYVEETTFAEPEVDADWEWWGIVESFSATPGVETESITYLPEYGATNKLEKRMNVKHRDMWEADITYHSQGFDELRFWTGEIGGTDDEVPTVQIGQIDESNDEFARWLGGMGEEVTVSVEEDSTVEMDGSFIFADGEDFVTDDYVDAEGSHAAEDTTEPFKYADLSNVEYGGVQLGGAIESLEFTISNDVAIVRDPDADRETLIDALQPVDREISVDLDLTYENFDIVEEVRAYEPKDLTFDIGTTTFTIGGVQFPEAPYEFSADDLISDTVSSDPANSISWV